MNILSRRNSVRQEAVMLNLLAIDTSGSDCRTLAHKESTWRICKLHGCGWRRGGGFVLGTRSWGNFWQTVAGDKGALQWVNPSGKARAHPVPETAKEKRRKKSWFHSPPPRVSPEVDHKCPFPASFQPLLQTARDTKHTSGIST